MQGEVQSLALPYPHKPKKIMAAYSILVGFKGDKKEAVMVDDSTLVRMFFKEEMIKGASSKFDSIEIVDTRTGRGKRWRNTKKDAAPATKVAKSK